MWGSSKVNDNYHFNSLNLIDNKTQQYTIDFKEVKSKVSKQDYEDLKFYGFASLAKTKLFVEFNVGNMIYFFKENNNQLIFDKTVNINDSIAFAYNFANTDSTLILLDYRATYEGVAKIKAFSYNFRTSYIHQVFEKVMTSNSACYDVTNTRFYDANENYFLITDNLEYKIYLFNSNGIKINEFEKPLLITEKSKRILNPINQPKIFIDSISQELKITPRIIKTQFVNDTDIIVNYCIKPAIDINGIEIKNSMIDLLTVRNGKIIFKKTYDDTYIYEQLSFQKTGKINQSQFNPSVRNGFFFFFTGNHLVNFDFKQLIPKSNTSFNKHIRKAKLSVLNLKSNLIYSLYEFKY